MNTQTAVNPREHDEAIAAMYHELDAAHRRNGAAQDRVMRLAGFERHYFTTRSDSISWATRTVGPDGRWQYLRRTFEEAVAICREHLDERNLTVGATPREGLAKLHETVCEVTEIQSRIADAEVAYTGWSRFFLVTSSAGHVHRGRNCSSCRPTTSYGWLPKLSGKTEAEAVEVLGATLCSVCFPSAPVEWQGGKLTAAKAAALAA